MEQPYNHPAFRQPEDPTIALWRYFDFNKFEWLVNSGRLFMPQVNQLRDPLEGTRPEGDLKWWQREAVNADSEEHRLILEHNSEFFSRMSKMFRDNYYVSCWHMNQYENHAMWRCYTTQARAVAIKTTYNTLREILPDYINIGLVRYIDYSTERLPTMNLFEYIMHKEAYYSFENEVRAVAVLPVEGGLGDEHFRKNHFELEKNPGFLVFAPVIDVRLLIHDIIIHPQAPPDFETDLNEICSKFRLPKPRRSRINRDPIF